MTMAIERTFIPGSTDWRHASWERALEAAIRIGTRAQPYRVHKTDGSWWVSRTERRGSTPHGPWRPKL